MSTLFGSETNDTTYLKHLKFPDAELKTWDDLLKAICEKEFIISKKKNIITKSDNARQAVLDSHADELASLDESIAKESAKISEFIENHADEFKDVPSRDIGEGITIEAVAKIKYKIKHKKESNNGSNG